MASPTFLCFWEVPVASPSDRSRPPALLCAVKETMMGQMHGHYQKACVCLKQMKLQSEVSEVSHCDTRKVTGCTAAKVSVCACPVPAPGVPRARGLHPQSCPGRRQERKLLRKKTILDSGCVKVGLFSKGPAERDTGVTCRPAHSVRQAVLARGGRHARCPASA